MDDQQNQPLAGQYGIRGFPTIKVCAGQSLIVRNLILYPDLVNNFHISPGATTRHIDILVVQALAAAKANKVIHIAK